MLLFGCHPRKGDSMRSRFLSLTALAAAAVILGGIPPNSGASVYCPKGEVAQPASKQRVVAITVTVQFDDQSVRTISIKPTDAFADESVGEIWSSFDQW